VSVTITKSGADSYFDPRSHVKSAVWLGFSDNQRTAAVAHAIRLMNRALGSLVESETSDEDDQYYPDRATYEQALYMLVNSESIANGEQNGPKFIASAGEDSARKADMPLLAQEAKAWLGWGSGKGTITISRG
jgi:predicted RNA-binding protein with PUA-like domain